MSDRHAAILRLLDTRFDHLPEPLRREQAAAGFVHRAPARETCPDCLANGRTMFGCETCGGRGYTERVRERDPYATDHIAPYGLSGDRHEAARARDREIARLDEQLAAPKSEADVLAAANAHPYAWEVARRRMYRLFDYAALDRALERLRQDHPGMPPGSPRGLAFIDARMPDPIRAPEPPPELRVRGPLTRGAGLSARELRDADMRARALAGVSPDDLAAEFGVSKRTVYDVVARAA